MAEDWGNRMASGKSLLAEGIQALRERWEGLGLGERLTRAQPPQEPEIEGELFAARAREALGPHVSLATKKQIAAQLAKELRTETRPDFLSFKLAGLSLGLAPSRQELLGALKSIEEGSLEMSEAERKIRAALDGPRKGLIRLWLSVPGGIDFLVWLRAQTLAALAQSPELEPLEAELKSTLGDIFAQGMLRHEQVSWDSPARVLERIIGYEQVHAVGSITDLKHRLGDDRLIYAFFHSGWPGEPVAFLEIALTRGLAGSIEQLIRSEGRVAEEVDTAIFYAINAPHAGLRGISLGEELIRASCQAVAKQHPRIKRFCTLSPIPSLCKWIDEQSEARLQTLIGPLPKRLEMMAWQSLSAPEAPAPGAAVGPQSLGPWVKPLLATPWGPEREELASYALHKICAKYLSAEREGAKPRDPVARFHLGNGASIERLRFGADASEKGWRQSRGMMVNYLYDLESLTKNQKLMREGQHAASLRVRWLSR